MLGDGVESIGRVLALKFTTQSQKPVDPICHYRIQPVMTHYPHLILTVLLGAVGIWTALQPPADAQISGKPLIFDAASVKPLSALPVTAGRKGGRGPGGPGTADPGRIHYAAIRLKDLIINAYGVKDFQIVGPDWLNDDGEKTRFAIDATMPPSTTKEQLRLMLQNLLADRFKLEIHRETRDLPKYSLTVARNGIKMKESVESQPPGPEAASPPRGGPGRESLDQYGFPIFPRRPEGGAWTLLINGRGRLGVDRATIQDLVNALMNSHLRSLVTDDTGLKGKYDFLLTYATPRSPAARRRLAALDGKSARAFSAAPRSLRGDSVSTRSQARSKEGARGGDRHRSHRKEAYGN